MTHISRAMLMLIGLVIATTSGCTSYRVSSNVEPPTTSTPSLSASAPVLLAEDNLPGYKYTEIGPIEVSVKKLTIFHSDPTKEQANDALVDRARSLGATAVINIKYKSGIGLMTWGYMDATGTAVKLAE